MDRRTRTALTAVLAALALTSPVADGADGPAPTIVSNFTGTTLSGAPFNGSTSAGQAGRAVVLDAVVPVLQSGGAERQPGRGRQPEGDLRRHRGALRCRARCRASCRSTT